MYGVLCLCRVQGSLQVGPGDLDQEVLEDPLLVMHLGPSWAVPLEQGPWWDIQQVKEINQIRCDSFRTTFVIFLLFVYQTVKLCFFSPGPRGFAGMGVGGPPGVRPVAPRGVPLQPRPLMDFGEQPDGTVLPPEQMQVQFTSIMQLADDPFTMEILLRSCSLIILRRNVFSCSDWYSLNL